MRPRMKRPFFLLILLLLSVTFGASLRPLQSNIRNTPHESQTRSAMLAITHANVIDGISNQPLRDVTVVVRDGKIQSIGPTSPAADMPVLDLKGRWLLPGFVDAHAHIADLRAARTALASGTTTLRCLGVNHFVDIGIRDLNHAGVADLPDIVAAGYHVRPRPA